MSLFRALLLAALSVTPLAAQEPVLRPDDAARLNDLDRATGEALRAAFAGGDAGDLAVLAHALHGAPMPAELALATLPGDWNCRVIKLGGNLPLVVYQPFRCRAGEDGSFEKLTGSQRTTGRATIIDGTPVYVGTAYVDGTAPIPYADFPEGLPPDPGVTAPDVGLIEMTGANSGRILLPRPYVESVLNLLVLTR